MIELTKDRLDEARFFLGHLQEERAKHARPEKPPLAHFWYYLSAFVNAARSVTWVLKSEEKEKYDAWVTSWDDQKTEAEKELLKLTNEMQISAVKRGRIETVSRSEEVSIPISPLDPYQVHALRFHALRLRVGGGPWTISDVHYVELQGKEQEIVTVCEQYVEFLARLVKDFVDKHP